MRATYTPWARSALGDENRERIKWHLAHGLHLDVGSDSSPYQFTIRLFRQDWALVEERYDVRRAVLFETVAQMLQDAGEPLPTHVEWQRLKQAIDA